MEEEGAEKIMVGTLLRTSVESLGKESYGGKKKDISR